MHISKRAESMQESAIRKLNATATAAKERGVTVYHLNIGQPDIQTPSVFFEAMTNHHEEVLAYGPSDGLPELKTAMIQYFKHYSIDLSPPHILATTGASEAVLFVFNVIADPGDEIIVPEPFYTNYNGFGTMSGLRIVPVDTHADQGFHLPPAEEIERRISPRTRAIMICSPNNPTGAVYTEEEIRSLGEIARRHDLFLIADEVYKEFTYDGRSHFSVLELDDLSDRVIAIDSISKRFSACGARIGAVICRNETVMKSILKFAQARLCPPTLEQLGAVAAYELDPGYFAPINEEYRRRRDAVLELLDSRSDIAIRKPEGAFYLMASLPLADTDQFARWLLTDFTDQGETVMVAPGAGFYATPGRGKQEIRIAYVLERAKLQRAVQILMSGLDHYSAAYPDERA